MEKTDSDWNKKYSLRLPSLCLYTCRKISREGKEIENEENEKRKKKREEGWKQRERERERKAKVKSWNLDSGHVNYTVLIFTNILKYSRKNCRVHTYKDENQNSATYIFFLDEKMEGKKPILSIFATLLLSIIPTIRWRRKIFYFLTNFSFEIWMYLLISLTLCTLLPVLITFLISNEGITSIFKYCKIIFGTWWNIFMLFIDLSPDRISKIVSVKVYGGLN